jgi:hypothetical protein
MFLLASRELREYQSALDGNKRAFLLGRVGCSMANSKTATNSTRIGEPTLGHTRLGPLPKSKTWNHLIALSCSCSHLMFQSSEKRHCGHCSQCIDRRFAVAGAGLLSEALKQTMRVTCSSVRARKNWTVPLPLITRAVESNSNAGLMLRSQGTLTRK